MGLADSFNEGLRFGVARQDRENDKAERDRQFAYRVAQDRANREEHGMQADLEALKSTGLTRDDIQATRLRQESEAMLPPGFSPKDAGMSDAGLEPGRRVSGFQDRLAARQKADTEENLADANYKNASADWMRRRKDGPGGSGSAAPTVAALRQLMKPLEQKLKDDIELSPEEQETYDATSARLAQLGGSAYTKPADEPGFFERVAGKVGKVAGAFKSGMTGKGTLKVKFGNDVRELPDTPKNRQLASQPGYSLVN